MRVSTAISLLAAVAPSLCKDVKVLSWVGAGSGIDDVNNQHKCFEKDLIDGVTIRGTKSSSVGGVITADTLKGFDVLLMPGGEDRECSNSKVDNDAIRAFVKAGGGFYGTCAGADCGCTTWTVRPNASGAVYNAAAHPGIGVSRALCKGYSGVGKTEHTFTAEGQKLFGYDDTPVPIDHHNGPYFTTESGGTVLASYASGPHKGKASIVADTYGSGRSIIISPHPEHPDGTHGVKQNCNIVAYAAAYAAGAVDF